MDKILFLHYPACDTCRRAKRWLDERSLTYTARHIVEARPTASELKEWLYLSDKPLKAFWNTSGVHYKELALKDKLPTMSEEEQVTLLASDGKLVKRPLLILPDRVLVGFKPDEWAEVLRP